MTLFSDNTLNYTFTALSLGAVGQCSDYTTGKTLWSIVRFVVESDFV